MSLIRRVSDKVAADFEEAMKADGEKRKAEEQLQLERNRVVVAKMQEAANRIGEPLVDLERVLGRFGYFQLGDVVVLVEPFTQLKVPTLDPSNPRLLAMDYAVHLMAIREGGNLAKFRVGMLQLLDFDGLFKIMHSANADIKFDSGVVIAELAKRL